MTLVPAAPSSSTWTQNGQKPDKITEKNKNVKHERESEREKEKDENDRKHAATHEIDAMVRGLLTSISVKKYLEE